MSGATALFLLVVFAPVVETLIMGGVLLILLRLVSPAVAVILSSLGWGIAHSMGAPTWGLVIWWPFLIFSTLVRDLAEPRPCSPLSPCRRSRTDCITCRARSWSPTFPT